MAKKLINWYADKTETKVSKAQKFSADQLINMWFVENGTKCREVAGLLCWYNVKCTGYTKSKQGPGKVS